MQPMMPQFAPGGGFPGAPGAPGAYPGAPGVPGPFMPGVQPMQPAKVPGQQPRPPMSSMFGAAANSQAAMQATQTGTGLWYSIAGGPTDRAYFCAGPPIFPHGVRVALIWFAVSCLSQLAAYFSLASVASDWLRACNALSNIANVANFFGYAGGCTLYGVSSYGAAKGLLSATMALSIIAGIMYSIGLLAFAYFTITLEANKTKARARQQWLAQSGLMVIGGLTSFISTILWVYLVHGT